MRRILAFLAAAGFAIGACDSDPSGPTSFPVVVEIVPTAGTFALGDPVTAILTNHSLGSIYVTSDCGTPRIERWDNESWVHYSTVPQPCPLDIAPPSPIAPGKTVTVGFSSGHVDPPLPNGTYRFDVMVGTSLSGFDRYWSESFNIERFPILVEIVPASRTFARGEDIVADITNRSVATVYKYFDCYPTLERRIGDSWVRVEYHATWGCVDVYVPPTPISLGHSIPIRPLCNGLNSPLPAGEYRLKARIGLPVGDFGSEPFEIVDR